MTKRILNWGLLSTAQINRALIKPLRVSERNQLRTSMEIIGSRGTLTVPLPFHLGRNDKIYLQVGEEIETIEIPDRELYIGEVEDMADAVLLGKEPRMSLADSRDIIEMIVGLFESARLGKPVML
jgi:predicted dehydrogenase